jgi:hypothetical protein
VCTCACSLVPGHNAGHRTLASAPSPGFAALPPRFGVASSILPGGQATEWCDNVWQWYGSKEKLDIARQLHKLGVDIIEAGFPCASPDDLNAVRQIAQTVGNDIDASRDGYRATRSLTSSHFLASAMRSSRPWQYGSVVHEHLPFGRPRW